jgi:hypothetical protein
LIVLRVHKAIPSERWSGFMFLRGNYCTGTLFGAYLLGHINFFAMRTHKVLSVPYKNDRYDVDISVERKSKQCRIKANVVGHELLFVSSEGECVGALYREEIIADGLIREIAKRICEECL